MKLLTIAWIGVVVGPAAIWWLWSRRRWRARAIAVVLLVLYPLGAWAFLVEPQLLAVRQVTITSPAWRGPPVRIAAVSDIHVGAPHVSADRVRRVMARLSAEKPDVAVFLGDYAGGHEPAEVRSQPQRSQVLQGVAALGEAKALFGRFAVLGNHDWWYDGPAVEAQLRRSSVTVLENDAVRIDRPGGAFWIAGLADLDSRRMQPSPKRALGKVAADEPVVLLTHWPDPWPDVPARAALTLAGHTHCGQVNFPIVGRLLHASHGARRWPCGLYVDGDRQLYVTGGVGGSILPVRFRAPPEIVIVTLRGAP